MIKILSLILDRDLAGLTKLRTFVCCHFSYESLFQALVLKLQNVNLRFILNFLDLLKLISAISLLFYRSKFSARSLYALALASEAKFYSAALSNDVIDLLLILVSFLPQ